jgi:hypothetical protein
LTKTHVPPQTAGNTVAVKRAADVIGSDEVRRNGRWLDGGMWVYGLCYDCNHLAGRTYDEAYADFAAQVARLSTPFARAMQITQEIVPAAFFAPSLVAKCILYGMFGINPRLQVIFPELASDLATSSDLIRWPSKVTLRVGYTRGNPRLALLSSGVWMMRVLERREVHFSFADVIFPPLAWCLVTDDSSQNLGPPITQFLADASDWVRYSDERTSVDLRSITRRFGSVEHPALGRRRDSWVEAMGGRDSENSAVVLHGAMP